MAEINQYTLTHKELLEALIKHTDVHEGQWSLLVGMAVGTGNFGPTPEQASPGVMVTLNQFGIQRVIAGIPVAPGSIVADAAKINPKKKK
jgi:hypothetical protein